MSKTIENYINTWIIVRRDGRVCARTLSGIGPLLLGWIKQLDTHDGPAWFYSRTPDFNDDDVTVGGLKRADAVKGLVAELVSQDRGRRT